MNWTEEKIREIYEEAMRAAVTDEEFRAALLEDPKGAIEKLTGVSLPEDFKLKVLEGDPDCDMTILLPPMVDDTLSGEEMEQVAGGRTRLEGPMDKSTYVSTKDTDPYAK